MCRKKVVETTYVSPEGITIILWVMLTLNTVRKFEGCPQSMVSCFSDAAILDLLVPHPVYSNKFSTMEGLWSSVNHRRHNWRNAPPSLKGKSFSPHLPFRRWTLNGETCKSSRPPRWRWCFSSSRTSALTSDTNEQWPLALFRGAVQLNFSVGTTAVRKWRNFVKSQWFIPWRHGVAYHHKLLDTTFGSCET